MSYRVSIRDGEPSLIQNNVFFFLPAIAPHLRLGIVGEVGEGREIDIFFVLSFVLHDFFAFAFFF